MKNPPLPMILILCIFAAAACTNTDTVSEDFSLEGFNPIFDGISLNGWRKLSEFSGDSGKWEVIEGILAGQQFPPGEGGYLATEKRYADFELYAEVKADFPIDSGIFLRSQPDMLSYQITIDNRPDGEIGALYSHKGGGFLNHYPEGKNIWKENTFNTIKVRIIGQPPHIQAWINQREVLDYTDTKLEEGFRVPGSGWIVIQVHEGESSGAEKKVYFRRLMIKEIEEN
jgi:hypothetical protein